MKNSSSNSNFVNFSTIDRLDSRFQNQIDETNSEFNYKSGSTSKSGGWNPEDQFHFVKIYTEYSLNSSEGGTWRSLCVQRIQMEMTHITKKEIEV